MLLPLSPNARQGCVADAPALRAPLSRARLAVCQSALNWDPRSARKRDPLVRCVEGAFRLSLIHI